MNKLIKLSLVGLSCLFIISSCYKEDINVLYSRQIVISDSTKLELHKTNEDLQKLQSLYELINSKKSIKDVLYIPDEKNANAVRIVFTDNSTIDIPYGKDGKDGKDGGNGEDGHTPSIAISKDGYWLIDNVKTQYKAVAQDGVNGKSPKIVIIHDAEQPNDTDLYWAIKWTDTDVPEFILDPDGNKVRANGKDGKDGKETTSPNVSFPKISIEDKGDHYEFKITVSPNDAEQSYNFAKANIPIPLSVEVIEDNKDKDYVHLKIKSKQGLRLHYKRFYDNKYKSLVMASDAIDFYMHKLYTSRASVSFYVKGENEQSSQTEVIDVSKYTSPIFNAQIKYIIGVPNPLDENDLNYQSDFVNALVKLSDEAESTLTKFDYMVTNWSYFPNHAKGLSSDKYLYNDQLKGMLREEEDGHQGDLLISATSCDLYVKIKTDASTNNYLPDEQQWVKVENYYQESISNVSADDWDVTSPSRKIASTFFNDIDYVLTKYYSYKAEHALIDPLQESTM